MERKKVKGITIPRRESGKSRAFFRVTDGAGSIPFWACFVLSGPVLFISALGLEGVYFYGSKTC
jgi:hypothetical protein